MLKWIYELGVKHERNRIKGLLTEASQNFDKRAEIFFEEERSGRPHKPKAQKQFDIEQEARRVIDNLIFPKYEFSQQVTPPALIDRED